MAGSEHIAPIRLKSYLWLAELVAPVKQSELELYLLCFLLFSPL